VARLPPRLGIRLEDPIIVLVPLRLKRPSGGARSNVARRNPVMFDARAVARRFSQKLLSVRQAFPYTETD
jgi:hypothetical protein